MRCKLFTKMLTIAVLCAVVIGAGCRGGNIFGFQSTDDSNTGDLIVKGQELLRDGKYAEALVQFNKAVSADSLNSDALFFCSQGGISGLGIQCGGTVAGHHDGFWVKRRCTHFQQHQGHRNQTGLDRGGTIQIAADHDPHSEQTATDC